MIEKVLKDVLSLGGRLKKYTVSQWFCIRTQNVFPLKKLCV